MNTRIVGAVSYVFTVSDFFRMFIPLPIEPACLPWDNLWRLKFGSGPGPTPKWVVIHCSDRLTIPCNNFYQLALNLR
jgi:hypothetical protein